MQLIIAVKNSLHSSCTTSFCGPPSRGIETRFRCERRLRTEESGPSKGALVETAPDCWLLLWTVRCSLSGLLVVYRVAAAGSARRLEAWPSPAGPRSWWNKACSLPVLMLFAVFVLFRCLFDAVAAKRSRRAARRACASPCRPPPPLCPAPPTLPAVTSSFPGKLTIAAAASSARLSRFHLTQHHVLSFLPLSSHKLYLSLPSRFHFLTECGRFGSESQRKHNRFRAVVSKLRCFIMMELVFALGKRRFLLHSLHFLMLQLYDADKLWSLK